MTVPLTRDEVEQILAWSIRDRQVGAVWVQRLCREWLAHADEVGS